MIQTEYNFTLPRGYVDAAGQLHRQGRMRLATALDEIAPMQDPRLEANESYLPVLLLSRVVTQLGSLPAVTPAIIEGLFAADLAYLEDLYQRLNSSESVVMNVVCPHCNNPFHVEVAPL
ncbi:MAG: phage tail assembly protein [Chloroflexota bacterium]